MRFRFLLVPPAYCFKGTGTTSATRTVILRRTERDKYPWPSLVDYQDRYGVWEKHAKMNGSGKFLLIDRDGTILSTSYDAQEFEPIIIKALLCTQKSTYKFGSLKFISYLCSRRTKKY